MTCVFVSADWHIKHADRIWAHRPQITGDMTYAMQQVLHYVEQYEPAAFFLAGDIFDKPTVTSYGIELMNQFLSRCRRHDTDVYFVQGQHDFADPPILSSLSDRCKHLHGNRVMIDGCSYEGLDIIREAPDKIEVRADVLVTHQVWKELVPFNAPLSVECVRGPSVIISGDYHEALTMDINDVLFVSPGPLVPQAIDQVAQKALILIDASGEIKMLPIKSRPIYRFCVASVDDVTRVIEDLKSEKLIDPTLPDSVRKSIVVVDCLMKLNCVRDLREAAGDRYFLLVNPVAEESHIQEGVRPINDERSIEQMIAESANDESLASIALDYWRRGLPAVHEFFDGEITDEGR